MEQKSILLVEDDFLNRRLIKKILTSNNYGVLEAQNGEEAIEILKEDLVDLVILDINLGEEQQDGISLAMEINQTFRLPFIFLTAYETPEIINKAIATSPYTYLTKPIKSADLIASVELALRNFSNEMNHRKFIVVKKEEFNINLPVKSIDFIESDGNYLLIHSQKDVYKLRATIKQILEILPKNIFLQTHRAFIINKNKIQKFNIKTVIVNDRVIPVSKNNADTILQLNQKKIV